jgi:tRNA G18 (ribose-2'-O)-methylase SpoU
MTKVDKPTFYLILHNVRSCYNVGAIFRTADGAGINKIFLCGYTPTPKTISNFKFPISNQFLNSQIQKNNVDKISKTALGAEKYVEWEKHKQTWRLLEKLSAGSGTASGGKVHIVALEQSLKSKNLFDYKPPKNKSIALIAGHERKGLSKKILEYVDDIVEIPMHGKKESLNVAVAVGIAVYELTKKLR